MAIPIPRTIGGAANLLVLSLICVAIVTTVTAGTLGVFYSQIPLILNTPALASYLWLLPVGVFLTGIYQSLSYWAIRRKDFSTIARTSIHQGVGGVTAQIAFGILNIGSVGLILGQILGQCIGLYVVMRGTYIQDKNLLRHISSQRLIIMAKRYSRFPKFSTWQAMTNMASTMVPVILFAVLLSPTIAGLYMLAYRTLSMPLSLVGKSVGQVFVSRAAVAHQDGKLDELTLNTFQRLLRICLIPLIVGVVAPDLYAYIFGEDWRQAGIYAQWMVPWVIVQFVVSPIGTLTSILELQVAGMISQFGFLLFRVGAMLIAFHLGPNATVIAYAISGFIAYFLFGAWIIQKAGIGGGKIGLVIMKEIGLGLVIVLPLLIVIV